ncbi:MAG: hypothetical protein LBH58_00890 [Tannerellaceae bacterium]|jgi:hypothetical protein|nr:hypothetical protein [Tannerellaceae bacterium]
MEKIYRLTIFAVIFIELTVSCGKETPLEVGDFAEARFTLSVEFPQTRTGIPLPDNMEQDRITVYYGDIGQTSFQQGSLIGDTLVFNYPVLLKVGNPGRLRATYVCETYPPVVPGAETLTDSLYVDSEDPSTLQIAYAGDTYNIVLNFKHCNALADITFAGKNADDLAGRISKVFVLTSTGNTEKMFVDSLSKVILPAGCLLKYIIIFFNDGRELKVKNETTILFERNKRYPIRISLDTNELSINPEEGIDNWN